MLSSDVDISGLNLAFKRAITNLDTNIPVALSMSADMVAAEAKQTHEYTDRSSDLTNSIANAGVTGSLNRGTLEATVAAGEPYGYYVEKGTKPHAIKARFVTALRFPVPGGFRFARAVQHPGTKAYRFLENALEAKQPEISEALEDATELSFAQAGLE